MSYSLHIRDGDLNPAGPGGLAVVTSSQKLVQDLRHHLLEPRGHDPMHPSYGSTLDGGVNPDGSLPDETIGSLMSRERLAMIEAEIRRIIIFHQASQIQRAQADMMRYGGKHTLTTGEVISSINRIDILPIQDVVLARCYLRVESGGTVSMTRPV